MNTIPLQPAPGAVTSLVAMGAGVGASAHLLVWADDAAGVVGLVAFFAVSMHLLGVVVGLRPAIGVAAVIAPSPMAPSVLSLHIFVMVAFTLVLFAMTYDYDGKSELSRIEGVALLFAFIAYDTYVVLENVRMDG